MFGKPGNRLEAWLDRAGRRLAKGRALLAPAVDGAGGVWADLGCGDGIYTYLLCTLLAPESVVHAVDRDRRALDALAARLGNGVASVSLQIHCADFTKPLALPPLDGLLMANSLHFVRRKAEVLAPLVALLRPGGTLVLVEYNADRGNYAVPHPLPADDFPRLATSVGLRVPRIVARAPSSFLGEQYTGVALVDSG